MKFELLAVVRVTADFRAFGIKTGDVGTVVEIYDDGEYEVEFCGDKGETLAVFAVPGRQLQPAYVLKQAA